MTIALTYNPDLSRVQIVLSDLPDGEYLVERSTNQLFWQTVRGGAALIVSSGTASLDDYEFAVNLENHYRVTPLDPAPGLLLPGGDGDHASTPDDASLDITGDIDIRADFTVDNPATGVIQYLAAKWDFDVNQRSYTLRLDTAGNLELAWSTDGTDVLIAESTIPIEAGVRAVVRVTMDVDTGLGLQHRVRFYTADDLDGPWTLVDDLLSPGGSGATSIFASTSDLDVGGANSGTSGEFAGVMRAVEVYDGIDGTAVANPDFSAQVNGATSFDDAAGRTWTIGGNAEIVTVESDSITPPFGDCEVWLKSVRYPLLNQQITMADYSPLNRAGRVGVSSVQGRSFPTGSMDVAGAFTFELTFVTDTADQSRKLDLSLAVGDIFYLQFAPDGNPRFPPKSMYVVVLNAGIARLGIGEKRHLTVQLAEMAKPSPQVIGTTLIWGTVFNLYGDWDQLLNANPTWNDLLAIVGNPDDLVVM